MLQAPPVALDLSTLILLTTPPMRTRISVFLITLSGLILEVGLTRVYSASIWYHFAFVAISVALLGWGLGGFTVHLIKQAIAGARSGGSGAGEEKADRRRQEAASRRPKHAPQINKQQA